MRFNPRNEFPHKAKLIIPGQQVSDGGGGYTIEESTTQEIQCFIDTPNSSQKFNAMKLNQQLDRYMYVPYSLLEVIDTKTMTLEYSNKMFEFSSELEDQGGMNEVLKVALKEVDGHG